MTRSPAELTQRALSAFHVAGVMWLFTPLMWSLFFYVTDHPADSYNQQRWLVLGVGGVLILLTLVTAGTTGFAMILAKKAAAPLPRQDQDSGLDTSSGEPGWR